MAPVGRVNLCTKVTRRLISRWRVTAEQLEFMKKIYRITLSILLIIGGLAAAIFAVSLAFPFRDWIAVGGAIIILSIGVLLGTSGVQIAQGASVRDVFGDLFRSLGR